MYKTLDMMRRLLESKNYHGIHWQRVCLACWCEIAAGLPPEKQDRPCPWSVQDLVCALEHTDFMELHTENEAVYAWLVKTFPGLDGDTYYNNTADVPHEDPFPQDPHDA